MTGLALALFWSSALGVATTYLFYPAILWFWVGRRQQTDVPDADPDTWPRVTLVVVAHDEERVIGRRLENLAGLDYPGGSLGLLVLSDGSTDATVARARAAAPPHARVLDFPERLGKSGVLTEAMEHLQGEIVAFTDANSLFAVGALKALVAPFVDPSIGCVVGELTYINTSNPRVARGESLYWRYENALKRWESAVGSTIVANGSIYAVRRNLVRPQANHVDFDSMLPLQVIRSGQRVVFEPRARATEKAAESLEEEYGRKVRIINQQIWGLVAVRGLLAWRTCRAALMMFCHKILRWAVPFLLGVNLTAAAILIPTQVAILAVAAHAVVALAAVAGWILDRRGWPAGWLWVATYFWGVNLASVAAVLSCIGGRRIVSWEKATSTR